MSSEPATRSTGFEATKALLVFVPPVTVITALLFYFGWVRTYTQARALGADASVFAYTTRDYLLRSVDSLYFPLIALTGAGLAALLIHQQVAARLHSVSPDHPATGLARAGVVVVVLGVAGVAFGLLYSTGLLGRSRAVDILGPLLLGLGVLLTAYGGWLRNRARGDVGASAWGHTATAPWVPPVAAGLLLAVTLLSLFWAVGNYAIWRGQDLAVAIATDYRDRPAVVVYAADRLALAGVPEERVEGEEQAYAWRYSGLRLLDKVGDTWFLMPEDWAQEPRLILLTQTDSLRVELSRA